MASERVGLEVIQSLLTVDADEAGWVLDDERGPAMDLTTGWNPLPGLGLRGICPVRRSDVHEGSLRLDRVATDAADSR